MRALASVFFFLFLGQGILLSGQVSQGIEKVLVGDIRNKYGYSKWKVWDTKVQSFDGSTYQDDTTRAKNIAMRTPTGTRPFGWYFLEGKITGSYKDSCGLAFAFSYRSISGGDIRSYRAYGDTLYPLDTLKTVPSDTSDFSISLLLRQSDSLYIRVKPVSTNGKYSTTACVLYDLNLFGY